MTKPDLQRRLEAARQARREAAHPTAPSPEEVGRGHLPTAPPDRPVVIDLRTVHQVREATERSRQAAFDAAAARAGARRGPRSAFTHTPLARQPLRPASAEPETRTTTAPLQERCRACGGPLRLDLFDLVHSLAQLTCVDCGLLITARSPRA
jgi:hypothetical protein